MEPVSVRSSRKSLDKRLVQPHPIKRSKSYSYLESLKRKRAKENDLEKKQKRENFSFLTRMKSAKPPERNVSFPEDGEAERIVEPGPLEEPQNQIQEEPWNQISQIDHRVSDMKTFVEDEQNREPEQEVAQQEPTELQPAQSNTKPLNKQQSSSTAQTGQLQLSSQQQK